MGLQIKDRFWAYVEPSWYLLIACYGGLWGLIRLAMMSPMNLLDKSKVKDAIFAQFWLRVGPMFEEGDKETAVPSLVSFASGVVLELGPGLGSQLPRYNKAKVKKIYGVEPVLALHEPLRQKIKASGLTDIYEVIPCGVEDGAELEKYGIMPGTIDTLLSIQVLCSLPAPEKTMRELYRLLKPGGQLIVYEHVKSTDWLSGLIQDFYTTVWPFFIGNCHLNRSTQDFISQAGPWAKVDLTVPTVQDGWSTFPRIYGRLWKAD